MPTKELPLLLTLEQAMRVMGIEEAGAVRDGIRGGRIPPPIAAAGRLMFVRHHLPKVNASVDEASRANLRLEHRAECIEPA
jgi:hypothetical protein